jgi:hypothetical protein
VKRGHWFKIKNIRECEVDIEELPAFMSITGSNELVTCGDTNAYEASEAPLSVFMAFGMPKVEMTLSSTYIAESYLIISGCLQFSSVILNK